MCGIAGILTARRDRPLGPILAAMQASLAHRGPDGGGIAEVEIGDGFRLGMAHTRLAILDLSAAGRQPMHDPQSGAWIVYNGEIYNHRELRRELADRPYRSTSDTETILRGWEERGERVLDSLRGMFALALYDARRGKLWLVRDRLGVKPLYIARPDAETWVFASELRAILASGLIARRLDAAAVQSYLALGAAIAPSTMIEKVESVMPGEMWSFDVSRAATIEPEVSRYWRLPSPDANGKELRREEALERLRPLLAEAAGMRMLADVPVGVFLSGGIDSSAVVSLLASQGFRPQTFSIGFDETPYDETTHARVVAEHFGMEHARLVLRAGEMLGEFDAAVSAYDQPSLDGLNTYFISRAVRLQGMKVALSGLGGDELFAGYPYFKQMARLERPLAAAALRAVSASLGWWGSGGPRWTKLVEIASASADRVSRYAACRGVMPATRRRQVLATATQDPLLPPPLVAWLGPAVARLDAVNAHAAMEVSIYMANVLLRDTDQMSMAHALEARVPLLDHRLVETLATMSGGLKTAPGTRSRTKGLLVDALPEPLPATVVRRKKMGFVLPWERWLRSELRPWAAGLLADSRLVAAADLEPQGVAAIWSEFERGRPGIRATEILCLANLVHWTRQHGLEPSATA